MRKKKNNTLRNLILSSAVWYIIFTSVMGNIFIFSFVISNIINPYSENIIEVPKQVEPEVVVIRRGEGDFGIISDKIIRATETIFNITHLKFNESFVSEIRLGEINNSIVKGYFEAVNHTITIDKSFINGDLELFSVVLAHEMFHAAIHFKSYEEDNLTITYDNSWDKDVMEFLADLYSFALFPNEFKKFQSDYIRPEAELSQNFYFLRSTKCLSKSFSEITPNIKDFFNTIEANCQVKIPFTYTKVCKDVLRLNIAEVN